jgi:hypothetical protein
MADGGELMKATPSTAIREQFWETARRLPNSEAEWTKQQEMLRAWLDDPRFEVYQPIIERLLKVDFAATRRWAVAAQAAQELRQSDYDFDAWRRQRDYDLKHAQNHLP